MSAMLPEPPVEKADIDRFPVFGTAAFLFAIAVMPGAVSPGMVGAAADSFQLPESRLGIFIAMYFAGFGLVGASAYVWIREVNWRWVCAVGIGLMGLSFIALALTENYTAMLMLMFLNGCGAAMFGSPSITVLGDISRPEQGFSTMIIFSVVGAAILLALFPFVTQLAGFAGVVYVMAGTTLACLLLIPWMPVNSRKRHDSPQQEATSDTVTRRVDKSHVTQPLSAHVVMVLFTMGFIGMWAFYERVAHYAELSDTATGNALAIGTLFGTIGAPLAAFLRRRIPMYYCYAFSILCIVLTLLMLDLISLTNWIYLLLACSFQFWINAGFCLIMALIAEVDKVGRYVAMIPASESLGSFVGPIVTGIALELSGVTAMVIATVAAFVIGAGIFAYVDRKDRARARIVAD
ncbi:MAG: MFS transporter [Gammaproteobacteria bacterium]|nr:MFS transporter [Gammaproteobacteria bacterium]